MGQRDQTGQQQNAGARVCKPAAKEEAKKKKKSAARLVPVGLEDSAGAQKIV